MLCVTSPIHVENQSTPETDFPERMFGYFALLTRKYHLPVYPVVIFSYDTPLRPEPNRYIVAFPGKTVLKFQYTVIQLNRLPWRRFVKQANPVATALMGKMKIAPKDRPKVKIQCLRLLATHKLDPARSSMLAGFVEDYLILTAAEMKRYEREHRKLSPAEKEMTMNMISSWEQKGIDEGLLGLGAGGPTRRLAGGPTRRLAGGPTRRLAGGPTRRLAGGPTRRQGRLGRPFDPAAARPCLRGDHSAA